MIVIISYHFYFIKDEFFFYQKITYNSAITIIIISNSHCKGLSVCVSAIATIDEFRNNRPFKV